MGEPWEMVPNGDRCGRCGAEPVDGLCPNCNCPVPSPVTKLWPLLYLAVLAVLAIFFLPVLSKSGTAGSLPVLIVLAVMTSATFLLAFCVAWFAYTVRRGKDKRLLLRFMLSNFATVLGGGVLPILMTFAQMML